MTGSPSRLEGAFKARACEAASSGQSRRTLLRHAAAIATLPMTSGLLTACGGGDSAPAAPPPSVPPPAPPPADSPLGRLQAALRRPALGRNTQRLTVTQQRENSVDSAFGSDALVYPPIDNPGVATLANIPQVWGHRREQWVIRTGPGAVVEGRVMSPIVTMGCGLHFELDAQAFEILYVGHYAKATLIVDGQYMAPRFITTTLADGVEGEVLRNANRFVCFDFGSRARRRVSVYAWSERGPCALAVPAGSSITGWDRSSEPSMIAMADSYGQGYAADWDSGLFWAAAAQLGIPHLDIDAWGGTGYARVGTNRQTADPAYTFVGRLDRAIALQPDLFITAGGINDNIDRPSVDVDGNVIYASAIDAFQGYVDAVSTYYTRMRAALPDCVIVATGPWAPQQFIPTHPVAQAKADVVLETLQGLAGPWVFIDNLNGGWVNSAGASAPASGPWQTGTGTTAAPRGDGNGDLYIEYDGTHLTRGGKQHFAEVLAANLREALQAL